MSKQLWIREMVPSDLNRVLPFFEAINPVSTREQIAKWTEPMLATAPKLCLVALIDNHIVGAITSDFRHGVPFIEDFFVDAEHRAQGIGSLLLERIIKELQSLGCVFVKVEANPSTWPLALKFYYKHGFRVIGVEQDRFGVGPLGDAVVLKKPLK